MRGGAASVPVVIDDLDVVPIGVEHEGTVVAGVVDLPFARGAVVGVTGREGGAVKRVDGLVSGRRERNVKRLCRSATDQGEGTVPG